MTWVLLLRSSRLFGVAQSHQPYWALSNKVPKSQNPKITSLRSPFSLNTSFFSPRLATYTYLEDLAHFQQQFDQDIRICVSMSFVHVICVSMSFQLDPFFRTGCFFFYRLPLAWTPLGMNSWNSWTLTLNGLILHTIIILHTHVPRYYRRATELPVPVGLDAVDLDVHVLGPGGEPSSVGSLGSAASFKRLFALPIMVMMCFI